MEGSLDERNALWINGWPNGWLMVWMIDEWMEDEPIDE